MIGMQTVYGVEALIALTQMIILLKYILVLIEPYIIKAIL